MSVEYFLHLSYQRMRNNSHPWVLIVSIVFILHCSAIHGSVPRASFIPYGLANGDALLPPGDDTFTPVAIKFPLPFYGQLYNEVWVNVNGILTLGQGLGGQYHPICDGSTTVPYIAPYWADADLRYAGSGQISFREITDAATLDWGYNEIKKVYANAEGKKLQWGFVATWEDVTFYDSWDYCKIPLDDKTIRNTFQASIFHDGIDSYTVFLYEKITWTTGTGVPPGSTADCSGIATQYGPPAKVGINSGAGPSFHIAISCIPQVVTIEDTSNYPVAEPGKYVLILDEDVAVPSCQDFPIGQYNLRIRPVFVDPYGHFPITLQGACLDDTVDLTALTCTFDMKSIKVRITTVAEKTGSDIATCILPYLSVKGPVDVSLNVRRNGIISPYYGTIYSVSPDTQLNDIEISGSNTGTVIAQIKWDYTLIGPTALNLDLILLKTDHSDFQLKEVVYSRVDIPNIGFYNGEIDIGPTIPMDGYAFRLTPSPVQLNEHQTPSTYKKSIFSWLQNFGYLTAALNRDGCAAWAVADQVYGIPGGLIPCPPLRSQAQVDERFYQHFDAEGLEYVHPGASFAVRQRSNLPSHPSTSECTYDSSGNLARPPRIGGYSSRYGQQFELGFGSHYDVDTAPWYTCCIFSGNIQLSCQTYYNQRPMDNGAVYEPPASAKCGGDPHLTTFDSLDYTFNGAGEFTMIQSPSFKMQGRMEPYTFENGSLAQATVFTAFVMVQTDGVNATKLQVNSAFAGLEIYINDEFINTADPSYPPYPIVVTLSNSAGELVITSPSQINVLWTSGFTFVFTTSDEGRALNVLSSVEKSLYGQVNGLYGFFDGDDGTNDLQTPDGTTIPSSSSLETIHFDFGNKWKITSAADSLFKYATGKTWASYDLPDYLPTFIFPDPSTFPDEVLQMCGSSRNCLFDYGATGSIALANDTKAQEVKYLATVEALNIQVKLCPPVSIENGYFLDTNYYFLDSELTFVCNANYTLNGPSVIKCVERGPDNLVWSPRPPTCILCPGHGHDELKNGNHSCVHGHDHGHHHHQDGHDESKGKPYILKFYSGRR